MPAPYQIGNIRLEEGVGKNEDGTYRAFLDTPVSIRFTGGSAESKWFFQAPNSTTGEFETLTIKDSFILTPTNTSTSAQFTAGNTTIEYTPVLTKIKLCKMEE